MRDVESVSKVAVIGMRERGGRTFAKPISAGTIETVQNEIHERLEPGSQRFTDEHATHNGLDGLFFKHKGVHHSAGEYARGEKHTNRHRIGLGRLEARTPRCVSPRKGETFGPICR